MKTDEKQFSPVALAQSIAVGGRQQQRTSKLASIVRAHWLCLLCWGGFSVCFGQAPPNDNFTNAIPLYGNSLTFTGTLANATFEAGETPSLYFWDEPSVWWSWTATNSTTVLITPVAPGQGYGFDVLTGTNVSALAELDWNYMLPANRYICVSATQGTTYYIRVMGYSGGSFTLRLTATNSPVILTPPRNQTVPESESAFFSVFAAGLRPLTYQWQFAGNNLPSQTTPCLVLNNLATNQAGGYSVIVSNTSGVMTSAVANLTISPPNPPYSDAPICIANLKEIDFATQLWAVESRAATNAAPALTDISPYLNFNTHNIACPSGGSTATFYSSYVINGVSSQPFCMIDPVNHVLPPQDQLLITGQPQSQSNQAGATVTLLVSATGLEPMVFQWQKNGTNLMDSGNILGANTDTLALNAISDSDAANYSVIVTNSYHSVTSSIAVLTVVDAFPFIATQPLSQTVGVGSNVTFNVTVYGAPPFVSQWYFNGTPLGPPTAGTNVSSCTLSNVGTNESGNYSVLVVNSYGSVTSSNALLTVEVFPPSITAQTMNLLVLPGTNAVFGVSVSGTAPFGYQWQFNGTNLLNATNGLYSIPLVGTNNAGNYAVVVTNSAGSATSSNAALAVVLSPTSQTNYASSTARFTATAFSPEPLNYQWQKNGTNLVNGGNISGATNSTLAISGVSDVDAAAYSAVVSDAYASVTTSNAVLTVIDPPSITAQPMNLLVLPGTNVAFGVSVTSTIAFGYQWRFNGTNLLNATNALYSIPLVGTNNAGNYSVVVTNSAGSATSSNAELTVVLSPTSQTNYASSTATFTATAFSPEPLNYQWQKNGTNLADGGNLSGTTNSTLAIASVSDVDAASYSAVVSDAYSSVTTSNATLTVIDPPSITAQPLGQRIMLGSSVSFTVSVSGTAPFSYQWRFNSINLLNATNAAYVIQAVGATNTGNYSVVVTNLAGSVTSSNALLTVIVPPTLALQLWAGYPLLNLEGMLSNNFVVQYSTNLADTNWVNLLSLTNLSASPYLFLDPAGDDEPARFYRAFMQ